MATEVKHGPTPKFKTRLQQPLARYTLTVTGYYTKKDGIAAAGVSGVTFQSNKDAKRRAELLAMRSAFIGGWLELWLEHGGTWREGVAAIAAYPFAKVRAGLKRHRRQVVQAWYRPVRWWNRVMWTIREWRETPPSRWWRR